MASVLPSAGQASWWVDESPLIVPLWNGEALPLQNGHFPTHFIDDKKVVQIQGDLQS